MIFLGCFIILLKLGSFINARMLANEKVLCRINRGRIPLLYTKP